MSRARARIRRSCDDRLPPLLPATLPGDGSDSHERADRVLWGVWGVRGVCRLPRLALLFALYGLTRGVVGAEPPCLRRGVVGIVHENPAKGSVVPACAGDADPEASAASVGEVDMPASACQSIASSLVGGWWDETRAPSVARYAIGWGTLTVRGLSIRGLRSAASRLRAFVRRATFVALPPTSGVSSSMSSSSATSLSDSDPRLRWERDERRRPYMECAVPIGSSGASEWAMSTSSRAMVMSSTLAAFLSERRRARRTPGSSSLMVGGRVDEGGWSSTSSLWISSWMKVGRGVVADEKAILIKSGQCVTATGAQEGKLEGVRNRRMSCKETANVGGGYILRLGGFVCPMPFFHSLCRRSSVAVGAVTNAEDNRLNTRVASE
ncbi:hypothetical protein C8Q78DRAFT_1111177 [Trametes maxima]|nr:hypothetical protein C8Q78DRAFT_1111177 [Trametes maxima]